MKTLLLTIVAASSCIALHAAEVTIYSDNFSSDGDRTTPAGFTLSGVNNANGNPNSYVVTPGDYQFGYDAMGKSFVRFDLEGPGAGNPSVSASETLNNANVGSVFEAGTRYTLTYQISPSSSDPVTTSLEADGTVISSTSQTFSTPVANNAFETESFVFDTTTDPGVVGETIGLQTVVSDANLTYSRGGAVEGYSLSVPEPSTYALLGLGALALLFVGRRARLKA